jgi:hypothetical protein
MGQMNETDFWGDALVKWPEQVVAAMHLKAEDAAYLTSVGLPVGLGWPLDVRVPVAHEPPALCEGLPILAADGPVSICVDLQNGNRVVAMEVTQRRLVNLGVAKFGAFLMFYQDHRNRARVLDESGAHALIIDELEQTMRACDPGAMVDREAYWPVILEQIRYGM